ncbi:hypothetical protein ACLB2K_020305 [Fragaria x ananassa]
MVRDPRLVQQSTITVEKVSTNLLSQSCRPIDKNVHLSLSLPPETRSRSHYGQAANTIGASSIGEAQLVDPNPRVQNKGAPKGSKIPHLKCHFFSLVKESLKHEEIKRQSLLCDEQDLGSCSRRKRQRLEVVTNRGGLKRKLVELLVLVAKL